MVKFRVPSRAEICISSLIHGTRVPEFRHLSDSCLTARINGVTVALAVLGGEETPAGGRLPAASGRTDSMIKIEVTLNADPGGISPVVEGIMEMARRDRKSVV